MTDIVIVGASRTPVGSFCGALSSMPASDLGSATIQETLRRANVDGAEVDEVILGQILTAGAKQNPTRQAAMGAGLPIDTTSLSINYLCGSGLRAVALGMQSIMTGDNKIVVAGGQESMSQSMHAMHMRNGTKMGNSALVDTMMSDALLDAFHGYHMGITAENIVDKWNLSREEQDQFALTSQHRAEAAQKAGKFDAEIVPVTYSTRKGDVTVATDESPRHGATIESLAKLRPAFKKDGSVTAGNASGLNDGAATVVLMHADEAARRGLRPLARIASWGTCGVDPAIMGTGPIPASRKALAKAGWTVGDLGLIEANEAFAAQSLSVVKDLELDTNKVNVNGGAIALGHPVGASGCRILVTLLHEMARRDVKKGMATLCIGGGMGISMCLER